MIEINKLDLIILDNLMSFNLSSMCSDKWEAQKNLYFKIAISSKKV